MGTYNIIRLKSSEVSERFILEWHNVSAVFRIDCSDRGGLTSKKSNWVLDRLYFEHSCEDEVFKLFRNTKYSVSQSACDMTDLLIFAERNANRILQEIKNKYW